MINETWRPPSPIFWSASVSADYGFMVSYEHLILHTKKYFSINLGTSVARWSCPPQTDNFVAYPRQSILTASVFLDFRWWIFRTKSFNPYLTYSIAGPTLISRQHFGPANLGKNFLFQDFLGLGAQIGRRHAITIALILVHYSNGDLFVHNSGFDVPTTISVGYSFM